ncbi:MAG: sn-glycerol-3-phosphate import ATP-binding protein UgpC [Paracidovorax wautersii]|uniref:sn-glycerol-3-phosphate import ATP-binding protein UgpC n=1 Tax=Paracidovorax wautersii TaxID=1177982 RepID=A0A7V8FNQ8_9BURK|nr:MAG: sn-glycerol-3-phosphate import ATP-binding protein UgpC [Paracidovorax wautersii]
MARLAIQQLSKHYGASAAVQDVSLDAADGEFIVLLGPSGCGKTTTLRMVAGFVQPSAGSIHVGERDITTLPPWTRRCGLVFQNYALFPHMTVAENVAFGLAMQKIARAEQAPRVQQALAMVRLTGLDTRLPRQLSGGQQQRVAIARALAIQPDILLLDEPLSNLDAKLRQEVRIEIRELQRRLDLTTLMVTHDQEEALTMADRLVVMNGGRVRQIGTQQDLYERPADRFVAGFIGKASFIDGVFAPGGPFTSRGGLAVVCAAPPAAGPGSLGLRAEHLVLGAAATGQDNRYDGRIDYVGYLGASYELQIRLNEVDTVMAQLPNQRGEPAPRAGDTVAVGWSRHAGMAYAA